MILARYTGALRAADPLRPFLIATAASNLADGLYLVVVPLLAVQLTDAPGLVAGLSIAMTAPWLILGLHAGVLADRVDRRLLILAAHAFRAAALVGAAIAWLLGAFDIAMLYLLAIALGVAETLADTAAAAMPPALVGRERLARANSLVVATQTVANSFVGPALAGVLVAVTAVGALGASAWLYAVAAIAVGLVAGRFRPERPGGRGIWAESMEGITQLWRHPTLRPLTIATAAMNVLWGGWTATFVLFAVDPGPLELSAAGYGLLMTALGVGGVLGSSAAPMLRDRIGLPAALTLDFVGTGALFAFPIAASPVMAAIGITLAGFGSAVWVVLNATVRQTIVADHLLSRAYGAHRLVSWGALPLGAALAAIAVEAVGVEWLFRLAALASVLPLVVWIAWLTRRKRRWTDA